MITFVRCVFAGSLVASLAATSAAQVTRHGSGYLFRLKLYKGEKIHFKIPFVIEGLQPKAPMSFHFGMSLSVIKMSNGNATVKVGKLESGALMLPDFEKSGGTFEVDQRGHVKGSAPSLSGFCIQFPEDPIQVGSSFTAPVTVPGGGSLSGGVDTAKATFTFKGFSGSGAKRQALLRFHVAGNRAPGGTISVRMSDGVIDKYFTKFYATPPGADPNSQPLTISATIIRA